MKKIFNRRLYKLILHGMTDIAGQASYSVKGLRTIGEKVDLVVWRRNNFNYSNEKCLNIGKNIILYPYYFIKMIIFAFQAMCKYSIFHFHFGYTLIPFSFDLFWLKLFNKQFFMEFHGSDIRWVFYRRKPNYYMDKCLPQFSKFKVLWLKKIFYFADKIILHDAELIKHIPVSKDKIGIVPLKIELNKFIPRYPNEDKEIVTIVHASSNYILKGTEIVIKVIEELSKEYKLKFILVHDKSQEDALKIYRQADIIIDQLYAGTYGVFAIEAMALGKPVISYISDEMINNFPKELPIVNANIDNLKQKLEGLIVNPKERLDRGRAGRRYVENYHDYKKIARLLKEVYYNNYFENDSKKVFEKVRKLKENE